MSAFSLSIARAEVVQKAHVAVKIMQGFQRIRHSGAAACSSVFRVTGYMAWSGFRKKKKEKKKEGFRRKHWGKIPTRVINNALETSH